MGLEEKKEEETSDIINEKEFFIEYHNILMMDGEDSPWNFEGKEQASFPNLNNKQGLAR